MNNTKHQQMVKNVTADKFRSSTTRVSKTTPLYPASAEREFQRITNGYIRILNQTLQEYLPGLMDAYKEERSGVSRRDGLFDLNSEVRRVFMKVAEVVEQKVSRFRLDKKVEQIAVMTKNASLREWKKAVKNTLGIDLLDDYYKGDFYESAIRRWTDENVLKIKSIPSQTLGEMQKIVSDGYQNGETITTITKSIQEFYRVTKSKARALARDQVSTLNSQITQLQQKDAGCTRYRWSDSRDSRVRDCHRSLNGKIFEWDNPPEMWYSTKSRGIVTTGRRCNPGEDYACRCVAIPVFDAETLDIPMKGPVEKQAERNSV